MALIPVITQRSSIISASIASIQKKRLLTRRMPMPTYRKLLAIMQRRPSREPRSNTPGHRFIFAGGVHLVLALSKTCALVREVNISVLQHAAYEGPGEIAVWATRHGHSVNVHHLYCGDACPPLDAFDLLVVMGGEMNIYQYRDWPWLKPEGAFIKTALERGKRVVGMCLGASVDRPMPWGHRLCKTPRSSSAGFRSRGPRKRAQLSPASRPHRRCSTGTATRSDCRLERHDWRQATACPEQGFFVPGK